MVRLLVSAFFLMATAGFGAAYDCTTNDGTMVVEIRDGGAVDRNISPSTVSVRSGDSILFYRQCDQRPQRIYDQELIGVVCDEDGDLDAIYVGVFLPELDGFIELDDHRSVDIQCEEYQRPTNL